MASDFRISQLQDLLEFHGSFKIPFELQPKAKIPETLFALRHRIMAEENDEYLEACQAGDLEGIADALGDMLYVLLGTVITHGLQDKLPEIFAEIHRSNMSKLDENGAPIYREDGKIIKSAGYFKPNLKPILEDK